MRSVPSSSPESAPNNASFFTGQRVWVTGSRGFIGTSVVELLETFGASVHCFDGDVAQREVVASSLQEFQPGFVVSVFR